MSTEDENVRWLVTGKLCAFCQLSRRAHPLDKVGGTAGCNFSGGVSSRPCRHGLLFQRCHARCRPLFGWQSLFKGTFCSWFPSEKVPVNKHRHYMDDKGTFSLQYKVFGYMHFEQRPFSISLLWGHCMADQRSKTWRVWFIDHLTF